MSRSYSEPRVRDRGKYASQLQQMAYAREKEVYLSVHTLISTRVFISSRFIYRYILPAIQRDNSAVVILPIERAWAEGEATPWDSQQEFNLHDAYLALIDMLSESERLYLRSWREVARRSNPEFDIRTLFARRRCGKPLTREMKQALTAKTAFISFKFQYAWLKPGIVTQHKTVKAKEGFEFLRQVQEVFADPNISLPVPLVVLLDVPVYLNESLENNLLWFLRDASQLNIIVWLHAPLAGISKSLLSQFGNFVIFYPSQADVATIQNFLPLPQDLDLDDLSDKALIYTPSMGLDKYGLFDL